MSRIPLTELVISVIAENRQVLDALKEVEAAKERALKSGDSSGLQRELEKLASTVKGSSRALEPLVRNTESLVAEMRNLSIAVRTGIVPVSEGVKRYRELEASLKSQLGTLKEGSAAYRQASQIMKEAVAEAKRLEGAMKGASGAYRTDELKRYVQALTEIKTARNLGLASERDSLTQLKSLQSQMAQYAGSLEKAVLSYASFPRSWLPPLRSRSGSRPSRTGSSRLSGLTL